MEDLTFGLKNKNKSAAVQKYVQQISKNLGVQDQQSKELQNRQKNAAEEKKKADMLLLMNLGGVVDDKKNKKKNNNTDDLNRELDEENVKTASMDIYKD